MEDYTIGSGNVFKDLGYPNADEKLAKVKLASLINKIMEQRDLSQTETAEILGITPPEALALKNGRLKEFSLERLFSFLDFLDQRIDITIRHKPDSTVKHDVHAVHI